MPSPNTLFTEVTISTLFKRAGTLTDNVSKNNALVSYLKRKGKIRIEDGGTQIEQPLDLIENNTYLRFSGYDPLLVQQNEVLTNATYPWVSAAVCVTASGEEIRKNSGESRLFNLVKARIKNAERTAANNMSVDVYSDGALANQIGGLASLITNDGTGTVGGIVSGTFTGWKNQFYDMASTPSAANIVGYMNALWMKTVRGVDQPDLIVASHDVYSAYWASQQELQRYMSSESADAGFKTLKYHGVDVIFDSNVNFATSGTPTAYFLNTEFIELVMHSLAQWTAADERVPTAQDAVIIPILFMGNLVCSNRSLQGKLIP